MKNKVTDTTTTLGFFLYAKGDKSPFGGNRCEVPCAKIVITEHAENPLKSR